MFTFIRKQFVGFFKFLFSLYKLYLLLVCKFFDFIESDSNESPSDEKRLVLLKSDEDYYSFYNSLAFKKSIYSLLFLKNNFIIVDTIYLLFFSKKYNNNNINLFRSYFRILNTKNGFYINFNKLKNNYTFLDTLKNIFLFGLKSIWLGLRFWILPLGVGLLIIYYSMVIRCVPFNKIVMFWIIFGMFAYWLLSGFVFFIKKYQFSKFTTAIQRFWRRSYILFWLIEFSTFSVFFYLTLNANQESFYMFDQIQFFKTHLFSWRLFLLKLFPLTILLILGYLLLLSLKWNVLSKHSSLVTVITLLIVYIVWTEFYQFFHVINFYGNFNWIYEADERVWSLELEPRKTRTANHYLMLLLILKFWHIVLIVAFWVFFVLRGLEIGRLRYPALSANLQNFLILYLFGWVTMYPWLKFILRRYLDMPYYWFYVNNRELGYRVFFNDLNLLYYAVIDCFSFIWNFSNYFNFNFYYWSFDDENFLYSYRKTAIRNIVLSALSNN